MLAIAGYGCQRLAIAPPITGRYGRGGGYLHCRRRCSDIALVEARRATPGRPGGLGHRAALDVRQGWQRDRNWTLCEAVCDRSATASRLTTMWGIGGITW